MEIKYDQKLDTKYVRIKKGKIFHTKEEEDWLLFDCNKSGDVLGVEILNESRHPVSFSVIDGILTGYNLVEYISLGLGEESVELTLFNKKIKEPSLVEF